MPKLPSNVKCKNPLIIEVRMTSRRLPGKEILMFAYGYVTSMLQTNKMVKTIKGMVQLKVRI